MRLIIVVALLAVLVILVSVLGVNRNTEGIKTEERWDTPVGGIDVNGTWGTSIEIEYEDGSTEYLGSPPPVLEIKFGEKKVDNFKYLLFTKATSDTYPVIEVDMSGFYVDVVITDQTGDWGRILTSDELVMLDTDDVWVEVYRLQVDTDELDLLELDFSYNLSFLPGGVINHRAYSSDPWIPMLLPDWFFLVFNTVEGVGGEGEWWVEIELSGETGG